MKPIEFVKDNNNAYFRYMRQGIMFYSVQRLGTTEFYLFQVPIADLGDATINNTEKAMLLMRYIRKGIEDGTMVKYEE